MLSKPVNSSSIATGKSPQCSLYLIYIKKNIQTNNSCFFFITHSLLHCDKPKIERQNKIYELYRFHCRCVACRENYPMLNRLPKAKFPELVTSKCTLNDLKANEGAVLKAYMKTYENHYPCKQLFVAHKLLKIFYPGSIWNSCVSFLEWSVF